MLNALYLGSHNLISPVPIVSTPFSCFPSVQELLMILRCRVACFADSLFRRFSSPNFQVSLIFVLSMLDSSCRRVFGDKNVGGCFLDMLELGGVFPWFGRFMCVLALLLVWYYGMELIPLSSVLLLLSSFNMTRGQEETSTSQAGYRGGPGRDTPSSSSIIASLSMEELKSYCRIPNNISFELPDGLVEPTIGAKNGAIYVTREQLAVRLRFPISSLVK